MLTTLCFSFSNEHNACLCGTSARLRLSDLDSWPGVSEATCGKVAERLLSGLCYGH